MIPALLVCLQLIAELRNISRTVSANWATCRRLCERAALFEQILTEYKNNGTVLSAKMITALTQLQSSLQEISKYVKEFSEKTVVGSLSRIVNRNSHADDIAKLNADLGDRAADLQIVQTIDHETQRKQDLDDFKEEFNRAMTDQMRSMDKMGSNMEAAMEELKQDIRDNQAALQYAINALCHRPLNRSDISTIASENDKFCEVLEMRYQEIMTKSTAMLSEMSSLLVSDISRPVDEHLAFIVKMLSSNSGALSSADVKIREHYLAE